jgi:hypothetical protein
LIQIQHGLDGGIADGVRANLQVGGIGEGQSLAGLAQRQHI